MQPTCMAEAFQGAAQDPPHSAPRVEASNSRMPTCLSDRRDRRAQHGYNCTPMENVRQDPDRTTLSASRGDSTGVLAVLWRIFPPLLGQANSSIDFPLATLRATLHFSFPSSRCSPLHFLQAFIPLPFLSSKFVLST
jgi:hypothetical protein